MLRGEVCCGHGTAVEGCCGVQCAVDMGRQWRVRGAGCSVLLHDGRQRVQHRRGVCRRRLACHTVRRASACDELTVALASAC